MLRKIKYIILILGGIISIMFVVLPTPAGLSRPAQNSLAIFVLCISLWTTSIIPISITGLLAIVLLPALRVMDSKTAFSLFGSSPVFFILGVFIIAAALMKTGLSSRLALFFLTKFDRGPKFLIAGILLSSALLSFCMPEHAVAAMMLPIVLEISRALKLEPLISNYGKALFISLAWGAIIGGVGTLLGGARNPLAIGILQNTFNLNITFFQWMIAAVPIVSVLLLIALPYILLTFRMEIEDINPARDVLHQKIIILGEMSSSEKKLGLIMIITVLCWIFFGHHWGLANIAIFSAISLIILKIINWKDVEDYVNWSVILMYGGAIALGSALAQTNALVWVADTILGSYQLSTFMLFCIIVILSIVITEGMSNAAAVAVMLPVAFGFAQDNSINPIIMTYGVAIPAGLAYCMPIGTPPNAIAYSSGYYHISDSLKRGLVLNIISILIFLLMAKFYWPLIGLEF